MKNYKVLLVIILMVAMAFLTVGCTSEKDVTKENEVDTEKTDQGVANKEITEAPVEEYGSEFATDHDPVVTMTLNSGQVIKIQLYPSVAPNTVNNFIALINDGYYDGLIFHRVIEGFMLQGGCPIGTGTGGPGYTIKGEFAANDFENNISHKPGILSMARSNDFDSAGSQFFIMHEESTFLDGQYAGFGKVIEGQNVVDEIAVTKTDYMDKPEEEVSMETVSVDLNGYDFVEPEKMD